MLTEGISDDLLLSLHLLLQVSALHYLDRDKITEGFQTVASAGELCQPTIAGPSISIVSVHKFRI